MGLGLIRVGEFGRSNGFGHILPPLAAAVPPPSTSDDSDIRRMLETIMTVQGVHGQLLVDMLDELRSLRADLESFRRLPPLPPFDD